MVIHCSSTFLITLLVVGTRFVFFDRYMSKNVRG
jgi:hypothetical protein